MDKADDDSRLHRIFRELQGKGLIGRERRLVQCPFTPSARGCPALNCIRYRRAFYERYLLGASDDTLRFVLLHEEGHIRSGSSLLSALPVLLALMLLPAVLPFLQAGGPLVRFASIALLAVTVFSIYRIYCRRMCDEEFAADRYAAEAMRCCYGVKDPGSLLQNLLTGLRVEASAEPAQHRRTYGGLSRVIPGLFRSEPDYRPSIADRVQKIRAGVSADRLSSGRMRAPDTPVIPRE